MTMRIPCSVAIGLVLGGILLAVFAFWQGRAVSPVPHLARYLSSHLSPATVIHGHPSPALVGLSLIHGYAAALFRFGPLRTSALKSHHGRPHPQRRRRNAAGPHR